MTEKALFVGILRLYLPFVEVFMNRGLKRIVFLVSLLALATPTTKLWAQTNSAVSGYALVTPGPGLGTSTGFTGLLVFETFGFKGANFSNQTEILAPQMTTTALLFLNMSKLNNRDTGIAITNPGNNTGVVTMTMKNDLGIVVSIKDVVIGARQQIAQFVTQLFADQPGIPSEFIGTLSISSSIPVAIVALRFSGQSFTAEQLSNLSQPSPVPSGIISGQGQGTGAAFIIPNFVVGGGWGTQIVIVNTSTTATSVRVDLFSSNGDPMTATLNGTTGTTFISSQIEAAGVAVIGPSSSPF